MAIRQNQHPEKPIKRQSCNYVCEGDNSVYLFKPVVKSKFVEGAEAFDALEFFGVPVHSVFEDGKAVAGCLQQNLLGGRVEVGWSTVDKLRGDDAGAGDE